MKSSNFELGRIIAGLFIIKINVHIAQNAGGRSSTWPFEKKKENLKIRESDGAAGLRKRAIIF